VHPRLAEVGRRQRRQPAERLAGAVGAVEVLERLPGAKRSEAAVRILERGQRRRQRPRL